MRGFRIVGVGLVTLCAACGASRPAVTKAPDVAVAAPVVAQETAEASARYVDEDLGFEIIRPSAEWLLEPTDEQTPEGLEIPVVLRHRGTGAQVVLQVAPAVATPTELAERLTEGLRAQPDFVISDLEPIRLSDSAVGFDFRVGQGIQGRVAVREGSPGRIFMMFATWPSNAAADVPLSVDALLEGVRPLQVPASLEGAPL
jgi:hypothetical protein